MNCTLLHDERTFQMISKYSKKGHPPQEAAKPKAQPKPAPQPIKRRERTNRFFRYRGVSFIAVRQGDKVNISTWNEETKSSNPGVEVPKDKLSAATKALAKIVLAEKELDEIRTNDDG
jgi:hypothetical protein